MSEPPAKIVKYDSPADDTFVQLDTYTVCADAKYNYKKLAIACKQNDIDDIRRLLRLDANICRYTLNDVKGTQRSTPLTHAINRRNHAIVRLLLENGANVNECTKGTGQTALTYAVKIGDIDLVEQLRALHGNVQWIDMEGNTLFHIAVRYNQPKMVKHLSAFGIDVNHADKYGRTALHLAARRSSVKILSHLIAIGANLEARDASGRTALHVASEKPNIHVIEFLISKQADVSATNTLGMTPLHSAASVCQVKAMQVLLNHGANVASENEYKATPMSMALQCFFDDLRWQENDAYDAKWRASIELLLRYGANINHTDGTASCLASSIKRMSLSQLQFLLEKGIDPNATDRQGTSPLASIATHNAYAKKVRLLMIHGAEANPDCPANKCPMRLAIKHKCGDVIIAMMWRGAKVPTDIHPLHRVHYSLAPNQPAFLCSIKKLVQKRHIAVLSLVAWKNEPGLIDSATLDYLTLLCGM